MLTLPLAIEGRLLLCACWLGRCWSETAGIQRGHTDCSAIRLRAGGEIEVRTGDGEWRRASLQQGSVVFVRFAWIRARGDAGQSYTELLVGDARASRDWRRLQVIWRHIGAAV